MPEPLPRNKRPTGIHTDFSRFALAAHLFLAAVSAYAIGLYVAIRVDSPIVPVSSDSLGELSTWARPISLYQRFHHNDAQSLVQGLLLYADVYLGPWPWWTELFTILAIATLCVAIYRTVRRINTPVGACLAAAAFLLFTTSPLNPGQLFFYLWRKAELGAHFMCLALILFSAVAPTRQAPHRVRDLLLFLGVLIFSHAHKAFFYPFVFLALRFLRTPWRWERAITVAGGLLYAAYILFLDGFPLAMLSSHEVGATDRSFLPLLALFQLLTLLAAPLQAVAIVGHTPAISVIVGGLVLTAVVAMGARYIRNPTSTGHLSALLAATGLGMIALTILGRGDDYGVDIARISRYGFDSIVVLLAIGLFIAASPYRRVFQASITGLCLCLLLAQIGTWEKAAIWARQNQRDVNQLLAVSLGPETWLRDARFQAVRQRVEGIGRLESAGVFNFWLYTSRKHLTAPGSGAPPCRRYLRSTPRNITKGHLTEYVIGAAGKGGHADAVAFWQNNELLSLATNGRLYSKRAIWGYVAGSAAPTAVSFYRRGRGPESIHGCRLDPVPQQLPSGSMTHTR